MGIAENKNSAHRLIVDIVNTGNLSLLDEVMAADLIDHDLPPAVPPNREGFKMTIAGFRAAFPDLKYTIEEELADGDKVIHRLVGTGTMKGEFQGMQPTGKTASWQEMHIGRFDNAGKLVEHWAVIDQLGMMAQLGLMAPHT